MVTLVPKEADAGANALMVGVAGGGGGAGVGAGVTETGSSDPVSFEQEMVITDIISGSSQVIFFMTVVLCVLNVCWTKTSCCTRRSKIESRAIKNGGLQKLINGKDGHVRNSNWECVRCVLKHIAPNLRGHKIAT